MQLILTVNADTTINDLDGRLFVVADSGLNLLDEFTLEELRRSVDLWAAVTAGTISITDSYGQTLTAPTDLDPVIKAEVNDLSIGDLGDVTVTTPSDGQLIRWDATTSQWVNNSLPQYMVVYGRRGNNRANQWLRINGAIRANKSPYYLPWEATLLRIDVIVANVDIAGAFEVHTNIIDNPPASAAVATIPTTVGTNVYSLEPNLVLTAGTQIGVWIRGQYDEPVAYLYYGNVKR